MNGKTLRLIFLIACLPNLIAGCADSTSRPRQIVDLSTHAPLATRLPPPQQLSQPLTLWATWYAIHQAKSQQHGFPLILSDNSPTRELLNQHDWCRATLEGTVLITSRSGQQLYNHRDHRGPKQQSCRKFYPALNDRVHERMSRSRFISSTAKYGLGVKGMHLEPYRSIAIDPKVIPIGSVLYIPSARGMMVDPGNGTRFKLDGYFFAADIGSAIAGNHIDIFAGYSNENPMPGLISSRQEKTFKAYIIRDSEIQAAQDFGK